MEAAKVLDLHPVQFRELAMISTYLDYETFHPRGFSVSHIRKPERLILWPKWPEHAPTSKAPLSGAAMGLARTFGLDVDDVYKNGRLVTTLVDENHRPNFMPWDGAPNWPVPIIG
jgi:hypothetical protein